jgi:hypothetical protein
MVGRVDDVGNELAFAQEAAREILTPRRNEDARARTANGQRRRLLARPLQVPGDGYQLLADDRDLHLIEGLGEGQL